MVNSNSKRKIFLGIIVLAAASLFTILMTRLLDRSFDEERSSADASGPISYLESLGLSPEFWEGEKTFAIVPGDSQFWFVREENLINEPFSGELGSSIIKGYVSYSQDNLANFALTPIRIDLRDLKDEGGLRAVVVEEVLNIDQYPYMLFTPLTVDEIEISSAGDEFEVIIEGELTIRDITNPVTLQLYGSLVSMDKMRLEIVGEIIPADFGIEPPDLPFLGTAIEKGWLRANLVAIRDEVLIAETNESPIPTEGTEGTGVIVHDPNASPGYTLIAPMFSTTNYLIDQDSEVVHTWESEYPAFAVYLLEDGSLLRAAFIGRESIASKFGRSHGSTGRIERLNLAGEVDWFFEYSTDQYLLHHDIEPLPNGNILISVWEVVSEESAIKWGRDPSTVDTELWMDMLIEVDQEGHIVWEWRISDHLIQDFDPTLPNYDEIASHPELIDINAGRKWTQDWTHVNAIDYNPKLDQVMISVLGFNEFWIVDHGTSIEEAASHMGGKYGDGGDLLYRWGNPQSYGAGDQYDQQLFGFHDANWITPGVPGEGNILLFNNGNDRPGGEYSSVDEVAIPVNVNGDYHFPTETDEWHEQIVWSYTSEDPTDFIALNISGAQRLANGNTFITSGPSGELYEVSPDGHILWWYISPFGGSMDSDSTQGYGNDPESKRGPGEHVVNSIFRAFRYPQNYAGVLSIINQE